MVCIRNKNGDLVQIPTWLWSSIGSVALALSLALGGWGGATLYGATLDIATLKVEVENLKEANAKLDQILALLQQQRR